MKISQVAVFEACNERQTWEANAFMKRMDITIKQVSVSAAGSAHGYRNYITVWYEIEETNLPKESA